MSPAEVKLWQLLRRRAQGLKFRHQHPIGPYVADFYCPAFKLVIEINGKPTKWATDQRAMHAGTLCWRREVIERFASRRRSCATMPRASSSTF